MYLIPYFNHTLAEKVILIFFVYIMVNEINILHLILSK